VITMPARSRVRPAGLGQTAPGFDELPGTDGKRHSLSSFDDRDLLAVVFLGNGCPTAKACEDWLIGLQEAHGGRGLQVVAINSNNPYLSPPDTLEEMVRRAAGKGFNFPYLKDATGGVAQAFGVDRTPCALFFDAARVLRYRGRIADARDPSRVRRHDLACAIDDVLAGRSVEVPETEAFGCAVVW
jgi:peroxiredoxin